MNKILLLLATILLSSAAVHAQSAGSANVTSYKDGAGNQWVTLTPVTFSSAKKSKVQVTYDDYNAINDPNGVYKGKDNSAFDGVRQNKIRNINYYNNGVKLPPNSGKQF